MRGMVKAACCMSARCALVKAYLYYGAALVLLAGCRGLPPQAPPICPPIPVSLTRDCGRCGPDEPAPATNGELAEAWMDCRQCVAEQRIRMEAVRELAECRDTHRLPAR